MGAGCLAGGGRFWHWAEVLAAQLRERTRIRESCTLNVGSTSRQFSLNFLKVRGRGRPRQAVSHGGRIAVPLRHTRGAVPHLLSNTRDFSAFHVSLF